MRRERRTEYGVPELDGRTVDGRLERVGRQQQQQQQYSVANRERATPHKRQESVRHRGKNV
jgi:hypothetical protein